MVPYLLGILKSRHRLEARREIDYSEGLETRNQVFEESHHWHLNSASPDCLSIVRGSVWADYSCAVLGPFLAFLAFLAFPAFPVARGRLATTLRLVACTVPASSLGLKWVNYFRAVNRDGIQMGEEELGPVRLTRQQGRHRLAELK